MRRLLMIPVIGIAMILAGCESSDYFGGAGIGSILGLEVGSTPTEQDSKMLGEVAAKVEELKRDTTNAILDGVINDNERRNLDYLEANAREMLKRYRRDPRNPVERNAAFAATQKWREELEKSKQAK